MAVMWATEGAELAILDRAAALRSREGFLKALRAGRSEAFELLFALYRSQIYNLAARMVRNPEDAKDLTQEVFLKAFQQIPQQDGDLQLEPWLYRVAVNACLDHIRASKRHVTTPLSDQEEQASTTDVFEQAETTHLVEEALSQLSERHRLVLVLKDLHGFRHEEIAEVLGISRGAAETLLHRAREAFRTAFQTKLPPPETRAGCTYAREIAVQVVGRDISPLRKRELIEHAKVCPACRKQLHLEEEAVLGLGLFLGQLPLPTHFSLSLPSAAPAGAALGGSGTSSASTGISSSAAPSGGLFGGGALGGGALGGGASGTLATASGLLGKISALVGGKIAAAALITTLTVASSAAAIQIATHGGRLAGSGRAAAAARPDPASESTSLRTEGRSSAHNAPPHGRHLGADGEAAAKSRGRLAATRPGKAYGHAVATVHRTPAKGETTAASSRRANETLAVAHGRERSQAAPRAMPQSKTGADRPPAAADQHLKDTFVSASHSRAAT